MPVWAVVLFEAACFVQHQQAPRAPVACPAIELPESVGVCPAWPEVPACPVHPEVVQAPWQDYVGGSAVGAAVWWAIVGLGRLLWLKLGSLRSHARPEPVPSRRGGGVVG